MSRETSLMIKGRLSELPMDQQDEANDCFVAVKKVLAQYRPELAWLVLSMVCLEVEEANGEP